MLKRLSLAIPADIRDVDYNFQRILDDQERQDALLDGQVADTLVCFVPITAAEYYARWTLYDSVGGIYTPLEDWGFTNATLTEARSRVVADLNASKLYVYSVADYANRTWTIAQYSDTTYLLVSLDKVLILVRS